MGEIAKDIEVMDAVAPSDSSEEEGSEKEAVEVEKEAITATARGGKILGTMKDKLLEFKRVVEGGWVAYFGGGNLERTRAYHVWPGKNVFFFHGRLICGPDPRGLMLTTVSIILSSWIFTIYVGKDLLSHYRLIITISMILTILVLVNLVLVSSIDPGIIPRNDEESTEDVGTSNGTRRRRVTVDGVEKKLKYCRICKIYRPPRTCHCAVCDNCVEKFDHHCPWIGQCIALRNYRFYLTFVVSALVFFVYIFAFSCWRIHQRIWRNGTGFVGMLTNCPETVALVSFSFAAIGFLAGLAIYHVYLTAINQTAYENFRQQYVVSKNPYDKGIINNIMEVLFVPLPPSRVDFRAEVTPRQQFSTAQAREV